MTLKYLLDSSIVIDHFNGTGNASAFLEKVGAEAAISVITRAEVLVKARDQWEEFAVFLEEYVCLPIGPDEADTAAGLRGRYSIGLPDAFQAAIAKNEDLVLVTRDADFKKIPDLEVKIPYRLSSD